MLAVVFSFSGSLLGFWISGVALDFYGYIGLLLVILMTAGNSMLLINLINQNRSRDMTMRKAILMACSTRLRPVLISALSIMLIMLSLGFGLDESLSGLKSMSVAVIGGLFSFIFIVLIVMPVLYEGGVYEGKKNYNSNNR